MSIQRQHIGNTGNRWIAFKNKNIIVANLLFVFGVFCFFAIQKIPPFGIITLRIPFNNAWSMQTCSNYRRSLPSYFENTSETCIRAAALTLKSVGGVRKGTVRLTGTGSLLKINPNT